MHGAPRRSNVVLGFSLTLALVAALSGDIPERWPRRPCEAVSVG